MRSPQVLELSHFFSAARHQGTDPGPASWEHLFIRTCDGPTLANAGAARNAAGLEGREMRDHETFQQILDKSADANSRRLMDRARMASSIAKCTRNASSRRSAYHVKRRALEHGVATFAEAFALSGIEESGRLLRVNWRHEACLHLPMAACSERTLRWVEAERENEVRKWRAVREAA